MGVSGQGSGKFINQQEATMGSRKMLMTTAMVALLALPLAACSSTMRLKSSRMCQASGGTYSGNTCNAGTANAQSDTQLGMARGGTYIAALDMCEMEGDK